MPSKKFQNLITNNENSQNLFSKTKNKVYSNFGYITRYVDRISEEINMYYMLSFGRRRKREFEKNKRLYFEIKDILINFENNSNWIKDIIVLILLSIY